MLFALEERSAADVRRMEEMTGRWIATRGLGSYEGAWVAVTPHGVLPMDSHEISPTIGGGYTASEMFLICLLRFSQTNGSDPPNYVLGPKKSDSS